MSRMYLFKKPLSGTKEKLERVISYTHFMHFLLFVERLTKSLFQWRRIAEKASKQLNVRFGLWILVYFSNWCLMGSRHSVT